MKKDLSKVKTDVSEIKEIVMNHATENRSLFKYVESKFGEQQRIFKVVENELK
ncbi:hypothetical protein MUB24_18270 [Lederbergia sp. NSJ-179]|uniref:hypothetical protein n=1 Tax=Lederbergia sp. NSJ-179 TaxID=2931402 RepID=UPI001FD5644B|nr:hypothetical protein [Lederbergia sp. NSJ-179]MCJ7842788.1 hypothetical protein [Lederbergia sp. NSJ-179]